METAKIKPMNDDFPRLLVATEFAPNASGGGPAVIRQMLKGWPADKLYWWGCQPEVSQLFGLQVAAHAVAPIPHRLYPNRRWCGQKSWLLEHVWTPWATRHFHKTLATLKPDVVWVIPHGWSIPPLSRGLLKFGVPFHVTMQDFMDIDGYAARYGVARSQRLAAQQYQLYAGSTTRDATSHPMIADLLQQTGRPATQMLHAGVEAEELAALSLPPAPPTEVIRIAHAGSIQVEAVFPKFVAALSKIRGQLARPVSLEFFGNHSYRSRAWFDPTWMNERANLPAAQLTKALSQCTWGFSPMDLTDDDPHYNRVSFPTKFISYLAAGLPIITLGHPESSVVKMATAHDVGVCLTTADETVLAARLLTALSEPHPGLKFRPAIQACAAAEFDAAKMRARLHENLLRCAAQTKRGPVGRPN